MGAIGGAAGALRQAISGTCPLIPLKSEGSAPARGGPTRGHACEKGLLVVNHKLAAAMAATSDPKGVSPSPYRQHCPLSLWLNRSRPGMRASCIIALYAPKSVLSSTLPIRVRRRWFRSLRALPTQNLTDFVSAIRTASSSNPLLKCKGAWREYSDHSSIAKQSASRQRPPACA